MTTHAREEVALATVGDEQPRNAVTSTHDRLAARHRNRVRSMPHCHELVRGDVPTER